MKDININFTDIKNFAGRFAKNFSLIFFAVFLLILAFEIFEVKNSADIVLNVNQAPLAVSTQKGVRINFDTYNQIVNRIQAAPDFTPSVLITQDPFSAPVPNAQ